MGVIWLKTENGFKLEGTEFYITREKRVTRQGQPYYIYRLFKGLEAINTPQNASVTELKKLAEGIIGVYKEPPKKYDNNNTLLVSFRLNREKDWKLVEMLEGSSDKAGLIRMALEEYRIRYF